MSHIGAVEDSTLAVPVRVASPAQGGGNVQACVCLSLSVSLGYTLRLASG